jgi:hypothetical protein
MVFTEIKPQIDQLPPEEKLKVLAYLKHLRQADDPEYQRELARRHDDIEAGRGISLNEAKKLLEVPTSVRLGLIAD